MMDLWDTLRAWWVVWLIILFAVVVWWAYRPKNKKKWDEAANIPFEDDDGAPKNGR